MASALIVCFIRFVFVLVASPVATTPASTATTPAPEEYPEEGEDHPGRDVAKRPEKVEVRYDEEQHSKQQAQAYQDSYFISVFHGLRGSMR